jgi:hypothetical protein
MEGLFSELSVQITPAAVVRKDAKPKKVPFVKEIAALNYGMAVREQDIKNRAWNSGKPDDKKRKQITNINKESMFDFVENEIFSTLKKTPWKRLNDAYKMKFVTEFIAENDVISDKNKSKIVKHLIKHIDELDDVDYDMMTMKITKLNYVVAYKNHDSLVI